MENRDLEMLGIVRDNIGAYIQSMQNDRWLSCDFDATRYQKDMERLGRMIDEGIEPVETSITLRDVFDAFNAMKGAKAAFEAVDKPYTEARYKVSSCRDWVARMRRQHGEDSQEAQGAMKEYQQARAAFEEIHDSISSEDYSRLASAANVTEMAYRNIRRLHVLQCAQVARVALCDDDSWTTQPTRYKRMRRKVEEITDSALCGTGCRVSVYESGAVHINHAHDSYFTHTEYSDDVEISVFPDRNELPNLPEIRDSIYNPRREFEDSTTAADVVRLCESYVSNLEKIRALRDAYQESVAAVVMPYKVVGFDTEDFNRNARVTYC